MLTQRPRVESCVLSEEASQPRALILNSRTGGSGRYAPDEAIHSSTSTDTSCPSVPTCGEASRLRTDYRLAAAAFRKAQDRLLSGWNNAKRRREIERARDEMIRARRSYETHVEIHGCLTPHAPFGLRASSPPRARSAPFFQSGIAGIRIGRIMRGERLC